MAGDDELCWWPAERVAEAIATRRLSAREYLDVLLTRIDRHNEALGLVVSLDERARVWARAADDLTARGELTGPLHGVSITVKDCFATAGLRTTAGSKELADYVPAEDADLVAALKRAGALVVGKTNMPACGGDVQASNELFGTARNPWSPRHTTGGSSGGSAGALAAGFSPLEFGSDVAGSIRIPAAFCGVLGHKPSFGVVSVYGHVPPFPRKLTTADMSVVGPLARSVDDLELALKTVAGPHPWDRPAWRLELPPERPIRQVATWFDDPYCPVDDEVRDALAHAADLLTGAGVTVEHAIPRELGLAASDLTFRRLLVDVSSGDCTEEELEDIERGRRPPRAELGGEFLSQRHRAWKLANEQRARLRASWREFFTRYDAIVLPVAPNLVPPHDDRPLQDRRVTVNGVERPYWDQIVWAGLTGVSYLPSTVVPIRLDSRGLPIGVAIAGAYLEDRTTLTAARLLARLLPPLGHPALDP